MGAAMKTLSTTMTLPVAFFLITTAAAANSDIPEMPEPKPLTPASGLKAVNVFWRGEKGSNGKVYPCIRIPSLIYASKEGVESMLAFAECRMRTGDGCYPDNITMSGGEDVCMKTSSDNGATWSDLQVVVENANQPTAVFVSVQESIILQVNSQGHVMQTSSADLGTTWSTPVAIDSDFGN